MYLNWHTVIRVAGIEMGQCLSRDCMRFFFGQHVLAPRDVKEEDDDFNNNSSSLLYRMDDTFDQWFV